MTPLHLHPTAPSAPAGSTPAPDSRPRRFHPTTLLWAVPGWRPFLEDAALAMALAGGNVTFGVAWTKARLWWQVYDPLGRRGQRVLIAAAARALQTCQACSADRSWREPTTLLPASLPITRDGPVRLRLCAACRLQCRDAARFLAGLEAADVTPAARVGS